MTTATPARLPLRLFVLAAMVAPLACVKLTPDETPGNGSKRPGLDGASQDAAPPPAITLVPTSRPALDEFLVQRKYLHFAAETRLHQSEGPHFGRVRTFMNPLMYNSLAAKMREHPQGAAAIKEIYKGGEVLAGWAVMVKVAARGDAGEGYFWFEAVDGRVVSEGRGNPVCAQCHESGQDLVLTPYPLL